MHYIFKTCYMSLKNLKLASYIDSYIYFNSILAHHIKHTTKAQCDKLSYSSHQLYGHTPHTWGIPQVGLAIVWSLKGQKLMLKCHWVNRKGRGMPRTNQSVTTEKRQSSNQSGESKEFICTSYIIYSCCYSYLILGYN